MTLTPPEQVTLDNITGIMPVPGRVWVSDIALAGE
jgi:hypothetical protein